MKLPRYCTRSLDSRGASHLVLPLAIVMLLALGGTFMMVAKRSTASLADATSAAAKTKAKQVKDPMGTLVLTSPKAQWNAAKIHPINANSTKPKCKTSGSVKSAGGGDYIVKFAKDKKGNAQPKNVKCSAIGGSEAYRIYYGNIVKANKFKAQGQGEYIAVDVDKDMCTLVQPKLPISQSVVSKVAPENNRCPVAAGSTDVPTPAPVTLHVSGLKTASKNKGLRGYVDIKDGSGSALSKAQCSSGTVKITIVGNKTSVTTTAPVKYASNIDTSYCIVSFRSNSSKIEACQNYTVHAEFAGTEYLQPGNDIEKKFLAGSYKQKNGTTVICSEPQ